MQLDTVLEEQRKLQEAEVETRSIKESGVVLMLFRLGRERFASSIAAVREVIDAVPIVPYPETTRRHLGVINLRGSIVPVVELRPEDQELERPRIIIFEDESENPFGVGADEVWKTESSDETQPGSSSMLRIEGNLVRLLSRGDLVAIAEDNDV